MQSTARSNTAKAWGLKAITKRFENKIITRIAKKTIELTIHVEPNSAMWTTPLVSSSMNPRQENFSRLAHSSNRCKSKQDHERQNRDQHHAPNIQGGYRGIVEVEEGPVVGRQRTDVRHVNLGCPDLLPHWLLLLRNGVLQGERSR